MEKRVALKGTEEGLYIHSGLPDRHRCREPHSPNTCVIKHS